MAEPEEATAAHRLHVWVDAQLPPSLARWLATEHHVEARHVQELGLLQSRDPDIFSAAAAATEPVAILTKDDDFSKLVIQHGPPPQVVWPRCGSGSSLELRCNLRDAWPCASQAARR